MTTQYYAPKHRGPDQQDPRQQGQEPTWEQYPYPARRSAPWWAIIAIGAAVVVACTFAFVYLFGHLSTAAPSGGAPSGGASPSTSGSNQHGTVNPAVPTHPAG